MGPRSTGHTQPTDRSSGAGAAQLFVLRCPTPITRTGTLALALAGVRVLVAVLQALRLDITMCWYQSCPAGTGHDCPQALCPQPGAQHNNLCVPQRVA